MARRRPTPCVGICSTTFGDLVCRGCQRYAHEIVQWNGYDEDQHQQVWQRLKGLRDQVLAQMVFCANAQCFKDYCHRASLAELEASDQMYAVLAHLAQNVSALEVAGLAFSEEWRPEQLSTETDSLGALQMLDAESYVRAQAHYERSYKVTV